VLDRIGNSVKISGGGVRHTRKQIDPIIIDRGAACVGRASKAYGSSGAGLMAKQRYWQEAPKLWRQQVACKRGQLITMFVIIKKKRICTWYVLQWDSNVTKKKGMEVVELVGVPRKTISKKFFRLICF
jgi:hypothetical protein